MAQSTQVTVIFLLVLQVLQAEQAAAASNRKALEQATAQVWGWQVPPTE